MLGEGRVRVFYLAFSCLNSSTCPVTCIKTLCGQIPWRLNPHISDILHWDLTRLSVIDPIKYQRLLFVLDVWVHVEIWFLIRVLQMWAMWDFVEISTKTLKTHLISLLSMKCTGDFIFVLFHNIKTHSWYRQQVVVIFSGLYKAPDVYMELYDFIESTQRWTGAVEGTESV